MYILSSCKKIAYVDMVIPSYVVIFGNEQCYLLILTIQGTFRVYINVKYIFQNQIDNRVKY